MVSYAAGSNSSLNLIEPLLTGRLYTWTSEWQPPTSAKLNIFLFFLEWEELYPSTSIRALPRILSYHIPVMLNPGETLPHPSIFRFENMWFSHDQSDSQVRHF